MTTPVVFIHGLWLHASSWQRWEDLFRDAGYSPLSPGWPGDADTVAESRANPDAMADLGIDDLVAHYAAILATLGRDPIVVGHSFGGMIAQDLLNQGRAKAAIVIDGIQTGDVLLLPLSALNATLPAYPSPGERHRAVSLTAQQFRSSFGRTLDPTESDALFERWAIPAPSQYLFEAAWADIARPVPVNLNSYDGERGPLLLVTGGREHSAPQALTTSALPRYRHSVAQTHLIQFADRGHGLTIDRGWREVAEACLIWLGANDL